MSAAALILVRHAEPVIDPVAPPPTWPLTEAGRAAALRLADVLLEFGPTAAVTSPEPKARETTEIMASRLGVVATVDPGLREHYRPNLPFGSRAEFEARMASAFASPSEPFFGGESAAQALARFSTAIARHSDRPLLVGTHGTVLSLFVAWRARFDAFDLWTSLAMPEAVVLADDGGVLARVR